jgi:hypothetical protein
MMMCCSACVKAFLQRAHNALQPYGGGVNPAKTKVNFDVDIMCKGEKLSLTRIPDDQPMPWCGLHIDSRTLEVSSTNVYSFCKCSAYRNCKLMKCVM